MIDERFKRYAPFFGKWKISRELGKGSFGQVFEIYWEDDLGSPSTSALKVIHIPSEETLRIQIEEQPNMDAVRNYFLKQVDRIKDEIQILQKCKGHSNIVSYEDHMIVENSGKNEIGWDILIRMELLYPLNPWFSRNEATQYDIIQMWLDIANALIYCEEQNIIHRDIKPANILRSASGRYKLSDFGVARKSMQATDASTRVGTERYMAPEVFKNQKYDKRADYYSLGCVIYYFLNKRRHVFLPPYPQEVDAEDNERAEKKRIGGEKIPKINDVSREINEVLLKSMAYRPANRYKSARELYRAIQNILETQGSELKLKYLNEDAASGSTKNRMDSYVAKTSKRSGTAKGASASKSSQTSKISKSSKNFVPIVMAGVLLVTGVSGVIYGVYSKNHSGNSAARLSAVGERTRLDGAENAMPPQSDLDIKELTEKQETPLDSAGKDQTQGEVKRQSDISEGNQLVSAEKDQTEDETKLSDIMTALQPNAGEDHLQSASEGKTMTGGKPDSAAHQESETKNTEKPTEKATEKPTEKVTEKPTEPVTEKVTEPETEAPTEPETEIPVPATPVLGNMERPGDGDTINQDIKIKGWILTNDSVGEIEAYVDLVSGQKVLLSIPLDQQALGEKTFEKRQKKYAAEIAAARGYEIKGNQSIAEIPDGSYELRLRVVHQNSKEEEILETVKVLISGGNGKKDGDVLDFMGVTEEEQTLKTHYIYQNKGFAIGVDEEETDEEKEQEISANSDQILLTGWINTKQGTSVGMYLDIDNQIYTADTLAQQGGSYEIIRVPRYLEAMDAELVGSTVQDMEEAGCIISLKLPFLDAGNHTIAISFNVGVPGEEPELVDIKPITITIDPTKIVNEKAVEMIKNAWEDEFPEPVTEEITEKEDGETEETSSLDQRKTGE